MRMKISLLIVLNIKVTVDLRAHTCMDALLFIFSVSVLAVGGGGEGGRGGGGFLNLTFPHQSGSLLVLWLNF